jgi:hypothetical protein
MKPIKDMPNHGRPREKLREQGVIALTDEELYVNGICDCYLRIFSFL